MEIFLDLINEYYLVFLIGAIVCILALIGYIVEKYTKKEKTTDYSAAVVNSNNNNVDTL